MHECPGTDIPADERGTLEDLLQCAEEYERRAGSSTDLDEWRRAERESLLQWADQRGRIVSEAEYGEIIGSFKRVAAGLEHQVWYDRNKGRIIKTTIPPDFGVNWFLKGYVQNILWCNAIFGDYMQLEGVYTSPDGVNVSLVMSQPFIEGRKPTEAEIAVWFESQGCRNLSKNRWQYPNGTVVTDAHTGNLIYATEGEDKGAVIPIDLQVEKMRHILD